MNTLKKLINCVNRTHLQPSYLIVFMSVFVLGCQPDKPVSLAESPSAQSPSAQSPSAESPSNALTYNTQQNSSSFPCDEVKMTQVDLRECLDKVINEVNKTLEAEQERVKQQMQELATLTQREQYVTRFKTANEQFNVYREAQCQFLLQAMSPGSGASILYRKCYIELTSQRIAQLQGL